jgi:late competence protein required for DNA uptake (superfamily II DNA/RNA helicase)
MLCPNCNSQQKTFSGRLQKKKYHCKKCMKEIKKYSKLGMCNNCLNLERRKVKNRPSKLQLLKEVEELGFCGTGRKYKVSDNCVRKWLKF